ncbi:MAG: gliding motility-associated C-terminal domain-containing protein [Bacteroidaceae bacterium]|nr:gliding motility-associated C-terminal domain-containing protein [Bacteroidaceae bacterium]
MSSLQSKLRCALWLVTLLTTSFELSAQTCSPTATFYYTTLEDGMTKEVEDHLSDMESYSGSAPLRFFFYANPENVGDYDARYEWKIFLAGQESSPLVHRFGEDLEYTFTQSGSFIVELTATFVHGTDTVSYPDEGEEGGRFTVTVAESKLEMPNAFSPNGDDHNDVYRAKPFPQTQSIVEFKATIFNRWGQRLYSWNDVNGGWDGKVNGKVVKDGVYFVNVVAKGADGHEYKIRKDVNVLTSLNRNNESSGSDE